VGLLGQSVPSWQELTSGRIGTKRERGRAETRPLSRFVPAGGVLLGAAGGVLLELPLRPSHAALVDIIRVRATPGKRIIDLNVWLGHGGPPIYCTRQSTQSNTGRGPVR
jgi:hypothetical protein